MSQESRVAPVRQARYKITSIKSPRQVGVLIEPFDGGLRSGDDNNVSRHRVSELQTGSDLSGKNLEKLLLQKTQVTSTHPPVDDDGSRPERVVHRRARSSLGDTYTHTSDNRLNNPSNGPNLFGNFQKRSLSISETVRRHGLLSTPDINLCGTGFFGGADEEFGFESQSSAGKRTLIFPQDKEEAYDSGGGFGSHQKHRAHSEPPRRRVVFDDAVRVEESLKGKTSAFSPLLTATPKPETDQTPFTPNTPAYRDSLNISSPPVTLSRSRTKGKRKKSSNKLRNNDFPPDTDFRGFEKVSPPLLNSDSARPGASPPRNIGSPREKCDLRSSPQVPDRSSSPPMVRPTPFGVRVKGSKKKPKGHAESKSVSPPTSRGKQESPDNACPKPCRDPPQSRSKSQTNLSRPDAEASSQDHKWPLCKSPCREKHRKKNYSFGKSWGYHYGHGRGNFFGNVARAFGDQLNTIAHRNRALHPFPGMMGLYVPDVGIDSLFQPPPDDGDEDVESSSSDENTRKSGKGSKHKGKTRGPQDTENSFYSADDHSILSTYPSSYTKSVGSKSSKKTQEGSRQMQTTSELTSKGYEEALHSPAPASEIRSSKSSRDPRISSQAHSRIQLEDNRRSSGSMPMIDDAEDRSYRSSPGDESGPFTLGEGGSERTIAEVKTVSLKSSHRDESIASGIFTADNSESIKSVRSAELESGRAPSVVVQESVKSSRRTLGESGQSSTPVGGQAVSAKTRTPVSGQSRTPVSGQSRTPVSIQSRTPVSVQSKTPQSVQPRTPASVQSRTPVSSQLESAQTRTPVSGQPSSAQARTPVSRQASSAQSRTPESITVQDDGPSRQSTKGSVSSGSELVVRDESGSVRSVVAVEGDTVRYVAGELLGDAPGESMRTLLAESENAQSLQKVEIQGVGKSERSEVNSSVVLDNASRQSDSPGLRSDGKSTGLPESRGTQSPGMRSEGKGAKSDSPGLRSEGKSWASVESAGRASESTGFKSEGRGPFTLESESHKSDSPGKRSEGKTSTVVESGGGVRESPGLQSEGKGSITLEEASHKSQSPGMRFEGKNSAVVESVGRICEDPGVRSEGKSSIILEDTSRDSPGLRSEGLSSGMIESADRLKSEEKSLVLEISSRKSESPGLRSDGRSSGMAESRKSESPGLRSGMAESLSRKSESQGLRSDGRSSGMAESRKSESQGLRSGGRSSGMAESRKSESPGLRSGVAESLSRKSESAGTRCSVMVEIASRKSDSPGLKSEIASRKSDSPGLLCDEKSVAVVDSASRKSVVKLESSAFSGVGDLSEKSRKSLVPPESMLEREKEEMRDEFDSDLRASTDKAMVVLEAEADPSGVKPTASETTEQPTMTGGTCDEVAVTICDQQKPRHMSSAESVFQVCTTVRSPGNVLTVNVSEVEHVEASFKSCLVRQCKDDSDTLKLDCSTQMDKSVKAKNESEEDRESRVIRHKRGSKKDAPYSKADSDESDVATKRPVQTDHTTGSETDLKYDQESTLATKRESLRATSEREEATLSSARKSSQKCKEHHIVVTSSTSPRSDCSSLQVTLTKCEDSDGEEYTESASSTCDEKVNYSQETRRSWRMSQQTSRHSKPERSYPCDEEEDEHVTSKKERASRHRGSSSNECSGVSSSDKRWRYSTEKDRDGREYKEKYSSERERICQEEERPKRHSGWSSSKYREKQYIAGYDEFVNDHSRKRDGRKASYVDDEEDWIQSQSSRSHKEKHRSHGSQPSSKIYCVDTHDDRSICSSYPSKKGFSISVQSKTPPEGSTDASNVEVRYESSRNCGSRQVKCTLSPEKQSSRYRDSAVKREDLSGSYRYKDQPGFSQGRKRRSCDTDSEQARVAPTGESSCEEESVEGSVTSTSSSHLSQESNRARETTHSDTPREYESYESPSPDLQSQDSRDEARENTLSCSIETLVEESQDTQSSGKRRKSQSLAEQNDDAVEMYSNGQIRKIKGRITFRSTDGGLQKPESGKTPAVAIQKGSVKMITSPSGVKVIRCDTSGELGTSSEDSCLTPVNACPGSICPAATNARLQNYENFLSDSCMERYERESQNIKERQRRLSQFCRALSAHSASRINPKSERAHPDTRRRCLPCGMPARMRLSLKTADGKPPTGSQCDDRSIRKGYKTDYRSRSNSARRIHESEVYTKGEIDLFGKVITPEQPLAIQQECNVWSISDQIPEQSRLSAAAYSQHSAATSFPRSSLFGDSQQFCFVEEERRVESRFVTHRIHPMPPNQIRFSSRESPTKSIMTAANMESPHFSLGYQATPMFESSRNGHRHKSRKHAETGKHRQTEKSAAALLDSYQSSASTLSRRKTRADSGNSSAAEKSDVYHSGSSSSDTIWSRNINFSSNAEKNMNSSSGGGGETMLSDYAYRCGVIDTLRLLDNDNLSVNSSIDVTAGGVSESLACRDYSEDQIGHLIRSLPPFPVARHSDEAFERVRQNSLRALVYAATMSNAWRAMQALKKDEDLQQWLEKARRETCTPLTSPPLTLTTPVESPQRKPKPVPSLNKSQSATIEKGDLTLASEEKQEVTTPHECDPVKSWEDETGDQKRAPTSKDSEQHISTLDTDRKSPLPEDASPETPEKDENRREKAARFTLPTSPKPKKPMVQAAHLEPEQETWIRQAILKKLNIVPDFSLVPLRLSDVTSFKDQPLRLSDVTSFKDQPLRLSDVTSFKDQPEIKKKHTHIPFREVIGEQTSALSFRGKSIASLCKPSVYLPNAQCKSAVCLPSSQTIRKTNSEFSTDKITVYLIVSETTLKKSGEAVTGNPNKEPSLNAMTESTFDPKLVQSFFAENDSPQLKKALTEKCCVLTLSDLYKSGQVSETTLTGKHFRHSGKFDEANTLTDSSWRQRQLYQDSPVSEVFNRERKTGEKLHSWLDEDGDILRLKSPQTVAKSQLLQNVLLEKSKTKPFRETGTRANDLNAKTESLLQGMSASFQIEPASSKDGRSLSFTRDWLSTFVPKGQLLSRPGDPTVPLSELPVSDTYQDSTVCATEANVKPSEARYKGLSQADKIQQQQQQQQHTPSSGKTNHRYSSCHVSPTDGHWSNRLGRKSMSSGAMEAKPDFKKVVKDIPNNSQPPISLFQSLIDGKVKVLYDRALKRWSSPDRKKYSVLHGKRRLRDTEAAKDVSCHKVVEKSSSATTNSNPKPKHAHSSLSVTFLQEGKSDQSITEGDILIMSLPAHFGRLEKDDKEAGSFQNYKEKLIDWIQGTLPHIIKKKSKSHLLKKKEGFVFKASRKKGSKVRGRRKYKSKHDKFGSTSSSCATNNSASRERSSTTFFDSSCDTTEIVSVSSPKFSDDERPSVGIHHRKKPGKSPRRRHRSPTKRAISPVPSSSQKYRRPQAHSETRRPFTYRSPLISMPQIRARPQSTPRKLTNKKKRHTSPAFRRGKVEEKDVKGADVGVSPRLAATGNMISTERPSLKKVWPSFNSSGISRVAQALNNVTRVPYDVIAASDTSCKEDEVVMEIAEDMENDSLAECEALESCLLTPILEESHSKDYLSTDKSDFESFIAKCKTKLQDIGKDQEKPQAEGPVVNKPNPDTTLPAVSGGLAKKTVSRSSSVKRKAVLNQIVNRANKLKQDLCGLIKNEDRQELLPPIFEREKHTCTCHNEDEYSTDLLYQDIDSLCLNLVTSRTYERLFMSRQASTPSYKSAFLRREMRSGIMQNTCGEETARRNEHELLKMYADRPSRRGQPVSRAGDSLAWHPMDCNLNMRTNVDHNRVFYTAHRKSFMGSGPAFESTSNIPLTSSVTPSRMFSNLCPNLNFNYLETDYKSSYLQNSSLHFNDYFTCSRLCKGGRQISPSRGRILGTMGSKWTSMDPVNLTMNDRDLSRWNYNESANNGDDSSSSGDASCHDHLDMLGDSGGKRENPCPSLSKGQASEDAMSAGGGHIRTTSQQFVEIGHTCEEKQDYLALGEHMPIDDAYCTCRDHECMSYEYFHPSFLCDKVSHIAARNINGSGNMFGRGLGSSDDRCFPQRTIQDHIGDSDDDFTSANEDLTRFSSSKTRQKLGRKISHEMDDTCNHPESMSYFIGDGPAGHFDAFEGIPKDDLLMSLSPMEEDNGSGISSYLQRSTVCERTGEDASGVASCRDSKPCESDCDCLPPKSSCQQQQQQQQQGNKAFGKHSCCGQGDISSKRVFTQWYVDDESAKQHSQRRVAVPTAAYSRKDIWSFPTGSRSVELDDGGEEEDDDDVEDEEEERDEDQDDEDEDEDDEDDDEEVEGVGHEEEDEEDEEDEDEDGDDEDDEAAGDVEEDEEMETRKGTATVASNEETGCTSLALDTGAVVHEKSSQNLQLFDNDRLKSNEQKSVKSKNLQPDLPSHKPTRPRDMTQNKRYTSETKSRLSNQVAVAGHQQAIGDHLRTQKPAGTLDKHTNTKSRHQARFSLEQIKVPAIEKERVRFACDDSGDWAEIGRGSYGCVYLGLLDGIIEVAIKDFYESSSWDLVIHEARMLMFLQDTGITPKFYGLRRRFDVSKQPSEYCIIMEYFGDGRTLFNVMSEKITLTSGEWLDIVGQLVAGLRLIHRKHVLINDLKADNILIDLTGGRKIIRYIDVGMATYRQGLTFQLPQDQMCKYNFLAPEVREGARTTTRSDIYSLGYMLEQMCRQADSSLGGLRKLINRCMEKNPARRPDIDDIVSQVHRFIASKAGGPVTFSSPRQQFLLTNSV